MHMGRLPIRPIRSSTRLQPQRRSLIIPEFGKLTPPVMAPGAVSVRSRVAADQVTSPPCVWVGLIGEKTYIHHADQP